MELFPKHTGLGADCGSGMLATALAMTMVGLNKRRDDFKAHAATQTTAADTPAHLELLQPRDDAAQRTCRCFHRSASPIALLLSTLRSRDSAAAHWRPAIRANGARHGRLRRPRD